MPSVWQMFWPTDQSRSTSAKARKRRSHHSRRPWAPSKVISSPHGPQSPTSSCSGHIIQLITQVFILDLPFGLRIVWIFGDVLVLLLGVWLQNPSPEFPEAQWQEKGFHIHHQSWELYMILVSHFIYIYIYDFFCVLILFYKYFFLKMKISIFFLFSWLSVCSLYILKKSLFAVKLIFIYQ